MNNLMKILRNKLVVLPTIALTLFTQAGLAEITLSRATFSYSSAPIISDARRLSRGLRSYRFRMKRGGVAFGSIAVPEGGLSITDISYSIADSDGQAIDDGSRLRLQVDWPDGRTEEVVAPIFDWQLIPIARFADTETDSCFTLFGELSDPTERIEGARVMNYHPAFVDTLMGLRLMQADIVLFDRNAIELPGETQSVGTDEEYTEYLLGAGEAAPDIELITSSFDAMQDYIERLKLEAGGISHESYVICDEDQKVAFDVREGLLTFSGHPVWSCSRREPALELLTRHDFEVVAQRIGQIQEGYRRHLYLRYAGALAGAQQDEDEDSSLVEDLVFSLIDRELRTMVGGQVKSLLLAQSESRFEEQAQQLLQNAIVEDSEELSDEQFAAKWTEAFATTRLEEIADNLLSSRLLKLMPMYSERLTEGIRTHNGINPAVYDAVLKTMRYAALFRYIKEQQPHKYADFLQSLNDAPLVPLVETPTQIVSSTESED